MKYGKISLLYGKLRYGMVHYVDFLLASTVRIGNTQNVIASHSCFCSFFHQSSLYPNQNICKMFLFTSM